MIQCPECDAVINIPDSASGGDSITCLQCGSSFEVVKSDVGLDLKPSVKIEEDWGQ